MGVRTARPRSSHDRARDPARPVGPSPGENRPTAALTGRTATEPPSASPALPTGTVAFVFTDIEGSTRLAQALPADRWEALLDRHRQLIRTAVAAHGGVEVMTEGDGFFLAFPRTAAAIAAVVQAQRALAAEPWPDDAPIRVRMGVHTGDGRLDRDRSYVGADVHRAARVAAAGHGGQVLLSETTSTLVADELPPGVGLRGLGEHRLKDLRPERICQLVVEGLRAEFPPIRSLDRQPNNLPTQLTSFVGRDAELAAASGLLGSSRLLTLTGPGGTGKTRLSLQLAADVSDRFPDGVWFVALEPVRDPAMIAGTILTTLGLIESAGRSARDVLLDWLSERAVLLVLDNFEQVIDGAPVVTDLLRGAPRLSIVVTSRAPLRVSGEQEYPVPGLPAPRDVLSLTDLEKMNLPAADRRLDAAAATQFEAVRLFIARAMAVRPDFRVTNDNAPAVAAIAARLHGMPLAIELAAARAKLLAPDAILERLEHQLGVLQAGARDLPERQQTLRGAIAWSHDLLGAGERRLLARLSVFVAGCELDSAEVVCGPAGELGGLDVLDGLMALSDQSLVRAEEIDGATRFRMLDTIREFAAERLSESGDRAVIEERHRAAFLALAESLTPRLSGDDQRVWLGRLERDHDNIRAVLDRAVAAGDADTAIRLGFAMWRFWQKRGHLAEARRRLGAMVDASWSRADPVLRARLMEAFGGVGWWQADLATMAPAYAEALALWEEIGDQREISNALYNDSFRYAITSDPSRSDPDRAGFRQMQRAHDIAASVGDERARANALWGIGNYLYFRDDEDSGVSQFREALEVFRRLGDRTMEAWSLHMLGTSLTRTRDVEEARRRAADALRLFHSFGDVAGITLVLDDFAAIAVFDGDLPRAARLWGAARALSSAGGVGLADFVDREFKFYNRPNARFAIDPTDLERWAAEGGSMTLDESVAMALDVGIDELAPHAHGGVR
ncbi:MAG TPA: adenylate/guanylate cyclase domain-containing protein [Candidatus Limnocylindrales bacterium]|nr:adenylate/guanylate cyclase domain-containing protein [Candidatus Limnocylindrales bacterium]